MKHASDTDTTRLGWSHTPQTPHKQAKPSATRQQTFMMKLELYQSDAEVHSKCGSEKKDNPL